MEEFLPLMVRNAEDSLQREEGCHRFDVMTVENDPDQIVLYEIYQDEAAFNEHCRAEHFMHFDAASAHLVREKIVTRARLIKPQSVSFSPQIDKSHLSITTK